MEYRLGYILISLFIGYMTRRRSQDTTTTKERRCDNADMKKPRHDNEAHLRCCDFTSSLSSLCFSAVASSLRRCCIVTSALSHLLFFCCRVFTSSHLRCRTFALSFSLFRLVMLPINREIRVWPKWYSVDFSMCLCVLFRDGNEYRFYYSSTQNR